MLYRAGLSSKEGLQGHDSVDPILFVKFPRMLRDPPSALPPGRYLRSTWILREGAWRQMEDRAVIPDSPVKFDRYVERAAFQYHPVRPALIATPVVEDLVQTPVPFPCGRQYVRTLPPEWRAVVGALARAIHGGYLGFTLPLRFNGRRLHEQIEYMGSSLWTRIIEAVWEDMSEKKRELEGYGKAIVPYVTEFQDCRDGLIIEFYDGAKELVHTYRDEVNKMKMRIKIFDTPKEVAVSSLIGVDEDNWWQRFAPGLDDMTDFDPGDYYVPQKQMSILCTGRQVDDAMCDYLADVFRNRQKDSENSAVFVGAGVLGVHRGSTRKSSNPARRSNSALITHGGRSSKELPLLQPSRELRSSLSTARSPGC